MQYYVDIYTGDKVGDATVHDASFTESKTIDGFASWPMSFDVTVQMTGDTLEFAEGRRLQGAVRSRCEDGKPATHLRCGQLGRSGGLLPDQYVRARRTMWKITAVDYLEQGATELRLRISGAPVIRL